MSRLKQNTLYYLMSLIYGGITSVRNFLFDKKILSSKRFPIPIICVGNLSVGGTGKTPHTEFIIRNIKKNFNVAVLSRGYKRKSKGFFLADGENDANIIGDEPFQIHTRFPQITVAVDEKRSRGIEKLMKIHPRIDVIILDDAFQHRYVQAGLNILLTDVTNLYTNDNMLPYGTLREYSKNSKRADMIIVTKCQDGVTTDDINRIEGELKVNTKQDVFFSKYDYEGIYPVFDNKIGTPKLTKRTSVLLVTGIENPKPIVKYLSEIVGQIDSMNYPDHYDFTIKDINDIRRRFLKLSNDKVIITTEKDAARIKSLENINETFKSYIFALPIEVQILNNEHNTFIQKINDYVKENRRNS